LSYNLAVLMKLDARLLQQIRNFQSIQEYESIQNSK